MILIQPNLLVLPDSEGESEWDLGALEWVQRRAECVRFCVGRSVSPGGMLPVSVDIDYEFGTRNPYNFLQVIYYKVSHSSGDIHLCHALLLLPYSKALLLGESDCYNLITYQKTTTL